MKKEYEYKTPCGSVVSCPVDSYGCRVVLGYEYDCDKYESKPMRAECKACKENKKVEYREVFSVDHEIACHKTTWLCFAKATDDKYKSLQQPLNIGFLDSPSDNLRRIFTIEFIIQTEDFRKVFYHDVHAIGDYQPMKCLADVLEEFYDDNKNEDGNCEFYMTNVDSGEILPIEFESFEEFHDSLVSARIVKYDSEYIEEE